MRKIVIFFICIILSINNLSFSQEAEKPVDDQIEKLTKDQKKYLNMMITGIILTSIGGVTLTAGLTLDTIIMIDPGIIPLTYHISYTKTMHNRSYNYNLDFNPISFSLDLTGITLLAVGIPLLAVGGANYKKIKSKMMSLIINNKIIPELAYNFGSSTFYLGARFNF